MQLDKIIIDLRTRNPWEAMDLGIKLIRALGARLFVPWILLMIPVLIVTLIMQLNGLAGIGVLLLWLFKPVYDSLVLHILSRGIFSDYLSAGDVFRSWKQWLPTGLKTSLYPWRFSLSRSFNLAVHQLEGLKGKERKQRLGVLHRKYHGHANGLTIICLHFEALVNVSLYGFLYVLVPEEFSGNMLDIFSGLDSNTAGIVMNTVFYWMAVTILEPFYVASGFMLYLNRRTQLEGWDIELSFRKMAERASRKRGYRTATAVAQG